MKKGALRRLLAGIRGLLFAVELLLHLPALLRLDAEGGGRTGQQPLDPDRLAGLLAVAVGAIVDPRQRLVDLLQQLALAIAGAQLQRMLLLQGRPVRGVRGEGKLAQVLGRGAGVLAQLLLELQQALAKAAQLQGVHLFRLGHLDDFCLGRKLRFACH